MKITDALLGEHGVFYAQFSFIEDALPGANITTIQSLGALLAAGLAPHAHIENDLLFPAIEAKIGEGGPTSVMRMDHEEIEGKLEQVAQLKGTHNDIEGALERLPQSSDLNDSRRLLKDALSLARDHFSKEENVLFPMAEQMLDENTLEQLGTQWSARRGVVLA